MKPSRYEDPELRTVAAIEIADIIDEERAEAVDSQLGLERMIDRLQDVLRRHGHDYKALTVQLYDNLGKRGELR